MWAELASVVLKPTFFMLVAFVVTFLVTRYVTHMIRDGRGPFRDNTMGGVHIHHEVYGIFLLLGTGTAEIAYRPGPPWTHLLAVLFGAGAALTLDEFAERTGFALPDGPYDTVAGYFMAQLGQLPASGDTIVAAVHQVDGESEDPTPLELKVTELDGRRAATLVVHRTDGGELLPLSD